MTANGKWLLARCVRMAILLALVLVACWAIHGVVRAHRIEANRRALLKQGFPESYAERLAVLQYDHPAWRFRILLVEDMDFADIVTKEEKPGWNLVAFAKPESNYTPYYAANAKAYDSGAWYQASRATIAYFLDPRNFLNERDIFMFETLGYDAASQTQTAVERMLARTFMSEATVDGGEKTFAALMTETGRNLGVSPVFLAGRLASEQGVFGSAQALGTIGDALTFYYTNGTDKVGNAVIWGKRFTQTNENTTKVMAKGKDAYNGFYNFFNFRAYGRGLFEIKYNAWIEATSDETRQKYFGPWDSQEKAIVGGALKIKERYIDTQRHTRYLQKFSVLPEAGAFRWKQYMQNIAAPLSESRNTFRAYDAADTLDAPYRFLIPIYRNLPKNPSPDPAEGKSVYSPSR